MTRKRQAPKRRLGWRMLRLTATASAGLVLAVGIADFARYCESVAALSVPEQPFADAIVVLTGGPDRIAAALTLLREKAAGQLLITGVDEQTTKAALRRHHPEADGLFSCCIDIGHEAVDTAGNAREARSWAEAGGHRSLIVVTNAFHMPRALLEFRGELPNARLIAYPVRDRGLQLDAWYRHPATLRALWREYLKLLLARYE